MQVDPQFECAWGKLSSCLQKAAEACTIRDLGRVENDHGNDEAGHECLVYRLIFAKSTVVLFRSTPIDRLSVPEALTNADSGTIDATSYATANQWNSTGLTSDGFVGGIRHLGPSRLHAHDGTAANIAEGSIQAAPIGRTT